MRIAYNYNWETSLKTQAKKTNTEWKVFQELKIEIISRLFFIISHLKDNSAFLTPKMSY